jgi:tetratricopeptide (TPR) repeat protein
LKILEQGRKRYPDESQLLFNEINYYLEAGQLDALITKLKEGIQKEPKNTGLYFTLGNVYDQIAQKEKDPAKVEENVKEALVWYNKTLELDPDNADAQYSIGAFYYNKAAKFSQEMKKLESDFSKAGQKKYEEAEKAMIAEFDAALPFFKKAEMADPNNQNTLIALKEIFARKNDVKASKEFKDRLDNVTGGGKNEKSYFKSN